MKRVAALGMGVVIAGSVAASAGVTVIDDFNGSVNLLGYKHNCYQSAPSRASESIQTETVDEASSAPNKYLRINFRKRNTGGKYGRGGWCGWYTLLHASGTDAPTYLNGEGKQMITFRVKGEKGGENFRVNLKDRKGQAEDRPPPATDIGAYLPEGQVTTEWQKAQVPLDSLDINVTELASFTINFEHDCYPDGAASGTIYIDDIGFE